MDSFSSSCWPFSCFSLLRACWVVCSAVGVMDVGVGAGRWFYGGQALAAAGAADAAAGAGVAVDFPAEAAAWAAAAPREVGDGQDVSDTAGRTCGLHRHIKPKRATPSVREAEIG